MKRVIITLMVAAFVVVAGLPAIGAIAQARSDAASAPSSYENPSLDTAGKAENPKP